jgi:Zn-dependent peptidase ImmA (M78 family)/transcriptional regulator with XRE-family HTH domain
MKGAGMVNHEQLGERLRLAREHARMNQTDVAQTLNVTGAALSQYESGKRKLDALTLQHLARLYGVPLGFFFGDEAAAADWEAALRTVAEELSAEGKAGISLLVDRLRTLEELHTLTGTPLPGRVHHPFEALPEDDVPDYAVARFAERVRRHFDLGNAPVPDMRLFLERHGFSVFTLPLGADEEAVSGLFFEHPTLGAVVVVNEDQAFTRRPFTLGHELAHAMYHHDRPAILCRDGDGRPLERFAERFAAHFLVPAEALDEQLGRLPGGRVSRPEEVIHLARYFGVSYGAMRWRLKETRRTAGTLPASREVRPVHAAQTLGYFPAPFEFGVRPLPPELRLPRSYIDLALRALETGRLSLRRVARLLGISDIELEERLHGDPNEATAEEEADEVYA